MKLFEPGRIGKLDIKNRIAMAAMGTMLVEPDGRLSQRSIDYYVARAKGGVGLIITDAARTRQIEQPPFTPLVAQLVVDSKIYASRLNELAETVHDYGTKVALQVVSGQGRNIKADILKSAGAVAPSPLPSFWDPHIIARELATEEVERLEQAFMIIAEIARNAGIDAIEINSHAGYLTDQFMTSLWNKRTDKYGGDLEGRLRFLLEIIKSIKKGAGADFPVIVKYSLTHYLEGGREIDEGLEIASILEKAGVDALEIDAGCYETAYWIFPPTTQPPGCLVDLAERVKNIVSIPVIAVGKLGYPELAESVLQEGKADFVALGRPLLADPDWANKVREGKLDDICPCIGDHEGCLGRTSVGISISCTVNPATGMEKELTLKPSERKKSVLVVGGGPAGMEAASIAALRGHTVTLWEKTDKLGGNLVPASVPNFKQDYRRLIDYLSTQLEKLGITIELKKEATPELIQEMKQDVVFIATGSTPLIPEIPGIQKDKVTTAVELLLGTKRVGEIVVVIGGGVVGCETALYLAQMHNVVTIVEILDSVASDMHFVNRMHLLKLLNDANVKIMTTVNVLEITDEGVAVKDKDGKISTLWAETVVLACGFNRDDRLLEVMKDKVPEVYAIGDCVEPRKVLNAIREGFRMARMI